MAVNIEEVCPLPDTDTDLFMYTWPECKACRKAEDLIKAYDNPRTGKPFTLATHDAKSIAWNLMKASGKNYMADGGLALFYLRMKDWIGGRQVFPMIFARVSDTQVTFLEGYAGLTRWMEKEGIQLDPKYLSKDWKAF